MDKQSWKKIETILDKILGLPASKQQEQIKILCNGDPYFRSIVWQVVDSIKNSGEVSLNHSESKKAIQKNLLNKFKNDCFDTRFLNRQIGRYKTLRQIGSSGMGTVFLAERSDGVFEKNVAIKILKEEFAQSDLKMKFKQERQILASLNHQSIAKIYDGGLIDGLPYFVMEFVEGVPFDLYCDNNKLTLNQRIELFKSVCDAVQYAHNNLIIHRDLKPQNILVNKNGILKILDFGIATLQSRKDLNSTNEFLTPAYTAPEQLAKENLTTSTDIYALGALLYQLLAGCKPANIEGISHKNLYELKQQFTPPSTCFKRLSANQKSVIAEKRSITPHKLIKRLSGELDVIVAKAMMPKTEDRYPSASHLKRDLDLHKNQFPIHARKRTLLYKSNKYVIRNFTGLGTALIMLFLIAGMLGFYFKNIQDERNIALYEANKAEEITGFMMDLFELNDPAQNNQNQMTARNLIYTGLEKSENLSDTELQAGIMTVMGNALTHLSDFQKAGDILEEAVEKNKSFHGENSIPTADAIFAFAKNESKNMNWERALPHFETAYQIYSELLDSDHLKVVNSLSKLTIAMWNTGNEEAALELSEQAYRMVRGGTLSNSPDLLDLVGDYAYHLVNKKDHEKAEEIFLQIIAIYIEIGGEGDSRLASPYNRLASLYRIQEDYQEAEYYFRKALEISSRTMGEDHRFTRMVRMNLITPLLRLGKHNEIEYHFQENIQISKERYGADHWRTGSAYGAYATYLVNRGFYEQAEELFKKNLTIYQKDIGEDHIWTAYVYGALAACYRFLGEEEPARQYFERHLPIYDERAPDFNNDHINQIRRLIRMYEEAGLNEDYDEYIDWYSSLLE